MIREVFGSSWLYSLGLCSLSLCLLGTVTAQERTPTPTITTPSRAPITVPLSPVTAPVDTPTQTQPIPAQPTQTQPKKLLSREQEPLAAVGSVRFTFATDKHEAYLDDEPVSLGFVPTNIGGRVMLALEETASLLSQPVEQEGNLWRWGDLTIDPTSGQLWLLGVPQHAAQSALVDRTLFVSVRLLAKVLGANLNVDSNTNLMTMIVVRGDEDPMLPQARFSTDKAVYAPGERVVYTEYAFDPDGANLTSRKWKGRQDAFFVPGEYTISLQVMNHHGAKSKPFSRTITVKGAAIDTPLSFALKYKKLGTHFADPLIQGYPNALARETSVNERYPLLFSDSPEKPKRSGVLYQDIVQGRARLLGYHMNALPSNARLYVLARNTEARPIEVTTERMGETAPTRIESILGQVTLLDYFASAQSPKAKTVALDAGQMVALYVSPLLAKGTGVNVLKDITSTGRTEITFAILEEALTPTQQVMQQLPYLPLDGRHQRGTFPNAVRRLRVDLKHFPSRVIIGDGKVDPILKGVDKITGQPMTLMGNYGLLYDLNIFGAEQTAIALSPRGGIYRGAMHIEDGLLEQTIKLPKKGNALTPDKPVLLWRPQQDNIKLDLIPASGSSLPINLVFYRLTHPVHSGTAPKTVSRATTYADGKRFKHYQP